MSTLHTLERETGRDLAEHDYWAQARAHVILEWIDDLSPDRLADIGCGSGYMTAAIADTGVEAVGIDIDEELIEVAQNRDTSASYRVGDALDLPWSHSSFDCVLFADVLEHFQEPTVPLQEARRVVSQDGTVIVSLPAFRTLMGPHDRHQDHHDRYNRKRLRWLADRAGFELTTARYTNAVPLVPYFITQRILNRDVPAAARGETPPVIDRIKNRLLDFEQSIEPPVGVTLLGQLTPTTPSPVSTVMLMNYEYPPACGGGGVFTHDLRTHLHDRGYHVPLVTNEADSADTSNSVPDLIRFPFESLSEVIRTVRTEQPDIINSHFALPTSLLLPLISRYTETPYVVNVMGADLHDPTRYHRLRPAMDFVNRYNVLRCANRIIVPSTDMQQRLPRDLRLKTHVVPYFVDRDEFTPGDRTQPADTLRLLTVARLVPRKNLTLALDSVAELLADGRDVTYTIVGSGSQRQTLEDHAESRNIADRVTFTGYVPDDQLPDYYQSHDVFVLPSKHEAFGIVFLEALSSGLPVVASATGGQTDIITDDVGVTVDADTATAYADAIRDVWAHYEQYAHHTRDRVTSRYTPSAILPEYERIYRAVVGHA